MNRQRRRQVVAEEMLSIASHELRTPLAAMRLHLDGIMRDARRGEEVLSERTSRRLAAMSRQVARLERLVADLLDARKLDDESTLTVEPAEVDLCAVVREVSARLAEACRNAGCQVDVIAEQSVVGLWDRVRLEQVVTNLLGNAIKYGARQPIELGVTRDGPRARLWVRDHGIGISAEEADRIFDRWVRTHHADDVADGSGLGLWIVRQIVDAHGGDIFVESAPGQGSTFIVELPLRAVAEARV